ncbi:MAG TPA: VWA domain-containing protein [Alloacidobacterium sp.]|nr:VWA domain-containing protein [Alloacidobacterium sp.]
MCFLAVPVTSFPVLLAQTKTSDTPQSSQPASTLSVDVKVVTLPVTVRDKKGQIVTNLTKDDFTLLEDNRPQKIKYFNLDTNLPLALGLLVDTSMSMRNAFDQEKSASKTFLNQMLTKPEGKAFVIHFDREVELLQDITASKDKLASSLEELGPTQQSYSPSDSGDSGSGQRRMHGGGTQLYDAIFLASDELMKKQSGRKALVVLSDGQDRGSRETLNSAIEAAQRTNTVVYTIYFQGEQQHDMGNRSGGYGRPRIGMGGGGWPGGGGYPGGRGGQRPSEEPHVDGKKIMIQIAQQTGGRMYEAKKKENFDQVYAGIAEELRSQYMLGYTPDKSSADESYHKITLTAKKKDLYVQTRDGYYADK